MNNFLGSGYPLNEKLKNLVKNLVTISKSYRLCKSIVFPFPQTISDVVTTRDEDLKEQQNSEAIIEDSNNIGEIDKIELIQVHTYLHPQKNLYRLKN